MIHSLLEADIACDFGAISGAPGARAAAQASPKPMERSPQSRSIKQATNQPLGARCDYHARLSQRLEASGKIGRFSDHRLLLSCPRAN
jgi:hypothetical protein